MFFSRPKINREKPETVIENHMRSAIVKTGGGKPEKTKGEGTMQRNDKRINHRFTIVETMEPEFDSIVMMVHPEERIIFENKAAKPQANIVQIMPRSRR